MKAYKVLRRLDDGRLVSAIAGAPHGRFHRLRSLEYSEAGTTERPMWGGPMAFFGEQADAVSFISDNPLALFDCTSEVWEVEIDDPIEYDDMETHPLWQGVSHRMGQWNLPRNTILSKRVTLLRKCFIAQPSEGVFEEVLSESV